MIHVDIMLTRPSKQKAAEFAEVGVLCPAKGAEGTELDLDSRRIGQLTAQTSVRLVGFSQLTHQSDILVFNVRTPISPEASTLWQ